MKTRVIAVALLLAGMALAPSLVLAQAPSFLPAPRPALRASLNATFGVVGAAQTRPAPLPPQFPVGPRPDLRSEPPMRASGVPADCGMPVIKADPAVDPKMAVPAPTGLTLAMRTLPAAACEGR